MEIGREGKKERLRGWLRKKEDWGKACLSGPPAFDDKKGRKKYQRETTKRLSEANILREM